ncbi:hypothetical protein SUGI_0245230 [Cryptomeria japonica]|uniref:uncharacterized protein LOC131053425 n=1 Tax=Cryptomeria japonica TaxID=3369 RepID=UPI002408D3E3|nr:uncharacterized protein LOC131053425 [Cryptomeria japonica]GLJ15018.1 hypothetical protein SUGI_0245230 [Cryptomeria japonica]
MDTDDNGSCGYVSKQEDCELNRVAEAGGALDDSTDLLITLSKHAINDIIDELDNPHASPKMDADENGSCGYGSKQKECEQNRVAEAGGALDDCTDLLITLSKHAINDIIDDLDKPHASPKMDADENGSCTYPSMLRTCKQRGILNPGEAGDDCTGEIITGNHNNFGKLSAEPTINEDELVGDLCNSPANHQVNGDNILSCGYPSKQENCEQSEVVKPGKADDCSRGTRKSSNNNQNICNSVFKSNILEYPYKRVDDFIFSDKSLVGRFTRMMRPSVPELSQWSHINWLPKLKSILMFKILANGFFKIEFFCHEDCEFVLENGPWFMGTAGLSIKRWSPNFDPQNPGPLKTPVWMILLDLPLEFRNEDLLIKICSKVGKVLQIAESTTEMNGQTSAARACVEVDLKEGLMESLDLQCKGTTWKQDLDYEGIPFRCKICRSADHLDGSCPKSSAKNVRKKK